MAKIVTTTESDLPKSYLNDAIIEIFPIKLWFGKEFYKEMIDLSPEELHDKISKSEIVPRLVHPSPSEIFPALKDVSEFSVIITSSDTFSQFYQTAIAIKDRYSLDNCKIIDTGSISMGAGLLTLLAKRMILQNWDSVKIYERINAVKDDTVVIGVSSEGIRSDFLPTNFLNQGVHKILNYDLLTQFTQGRKMTQLTKPKDKYSKLIKLLHMRFTKEQQVSCSILSSTNSEEALNLAELLKNNLNVVEIIESKVGARLNLHLGGNGSGIAISPFIDL